VLSRDRLIASQPQSRFDKTGNDFIFPNRRLVITGNKLWEVAAADWKIVSLRLVREIDRSNTTQLVSYPAAHPVPITLPGFAEIRLKLPLLPPDEKIDQRKVYGGDR
jgi:hypothetical protein